jgi:hypothetical protein
MNINKTVIFGILSVLSLPGCMPITPNLDSAFGVAVNQAKAQQTLNPDASRDTASVTGTSGVEGDLAIDAYHNSLKPTPPAPTIINIGGGLGGN